MSIVQAVLAVLLAVRPAASDAGESLDARTARLERAAEEIARTAEAYPGRELETAAALVTLGVHETRFARYVARGCFDVPAGGADCDDGKARSYFQVWAVGCPVLGVLPRGGKLELRAATSCAARIYWYGRRECNHVLGAFARYAVGHGCSWSGAYDRAATLRNVTRKLRALAR